MLTARCVALDTISLVAFVMACSGCPGRSAKSDIADAPPIPATTGIAPAAARALGPGAAGLRPADSTERSGFLGNGPDGLPNDSNQPPANTQQL